VKICHCPAAVKEVLSLVHIQNVSSLVEQVLGFNLNVVYPSQSECPPMLCPKNICEVRIVNQVFFARLRLHWSGCYGWSDWS